MAPIQENFTRRDFIKTTGAAATGTMVISPAFGRMLKNVIEKKKWLWWVRVAGEYHYTENSCWRSIRMWSSL